MPTRYLGLDVYNVRVHNDSQFGRVETCYICDRRWQALHT